MTLRAQLEAAQAESERLRALVEKAIAQFEHIELPYTARLLREELGKPPARIKR